MRAVLLTPRQIEYITTLVRRSVKFNLEHGNDKWAEKAIGLLCVLQASDGGETNPWKRKDKSKITVIQGGKH